MNMIHDTLSDEGLDIATLLRRAGGRDVPPASLQDAVRVRVRAEWQDMVQARTRHRRRVFGWSLVIGAAALVCGTLLVVNAMYAATLSVATLARIDGRLIASSNGDPLPSLVPGESIVAGESLRTDADSRAALRWPGGLSLRMDHDTAVKIISQTSIALIQGAVYVDAGQGEDLSIESALGSVRHLGTRYMVTAQPELLEVSIREGRVAIDSGAVSLVGSAGERIRMNASGTVERSALAATDVSWHWTAAAAPIFQIDHQSLAAFLAWISRQTGRPVVFDSPHAESAAAHVILRGSIEGLDLDTALSVVLSTTPLHRYPTIDESIGIALNNP